MNNIKPLFLACNLVGSLFFYAQGANAAEAPAIGSTTAVPAPTASAAAPSASTQPVAQEQELQLTDEQKKKKADWRDVQQNHLKAMLNNQMMIEEYALAEKYEAKKISKVAADATIELKEYYEQYARKSRDFIDSLTPEQKIQFKEIQKKRKEKMEQQLNNMAQNASK